MDPCPFVRIVIRSLALKLPAESAGAVQQSTPCYCKIKLKNFPSQFADNVPLNPPQSESNQIIDDQIYACFNLNKSELQKVVEKSVQKSKSCCLKIEIYSGRRGETCGFNGGKLVGTVDVKLGALENIANISSGRVSVIHNGWVGIGSRAQFYVNVRAEPDPRFVFQFEGEPECSPQVFQVNGNVRQAVFTCKFSFRNPGERNLRSRSSSDSSTSKSWLSSLISDREKPLTERKGWSVTIHDLSGSPVAAASMVTPFVPSPGTDRVSRSNPGAWLIMRPGHGTWKPWGRLEAWRESKGCDHVGYRFELLPDAAIGSVDTVTLANATVSTKSGGKFTIENTAGASPLPSPSSSYDFGSGSGSGSDVGPGSWAHLLYRGFVMSSTVAGGRRCSKPEVEVGVPHVTCKEDAAAFVALAAAMDLSMDACRLFSQKLRKELRQQDQGYAV